MQSNPNQPLKGLQVIELQAIGPVPFAGMLLSQLGASVTVINAPGNAQLGLPVKPEFDLFATNKDVQVLDLKSAGGQASIRALLAKTDVLLEGFRAGVLERIGLQPDSLLQSFPKLVIGRLSGYGNSGPLAKRAGHDINYLALSGVLNAIGDKQTPTVPLNLIGDFGGGAMHLLVGVLAKLVERSISGNGGVVSTSILAGTIGLTPMVYGLLADEQWQLERFTNLLDGGAPFYRVYKTRDDQFVAVGALEPKFFSQLLALTQLEHSIAAKKQFDQSTWPDMQQHFEQRFAQRTRDEWAQDAEKLDCCVSPVLDFIEASQHKHNTANQWYSSAPFAQPQPVINFTGTDTHD